MNLYDVDYQKWLAEQLANLKYCKWEHLDVDHLIEELEALNKSNKRELYSYFVVALAHLLKWKSQPEKRSGSWKGSIKNSRRRIERLFKDQPSLKPYLKEILLEAYAEAREWAEDETGLATFPTICPYSVQQIIDPEFLPD